MSDVTFMSTSGGTFSTRPEHTRTESARRRASTTNPTADPQSRSLDRGLSRVRQITINAGGRNIGLITRRSPLQARILAALDVDTRAWGTAGVA